MITVGSLFSGIGGIDLGLERAGMTVIWQVETNPYASQVLAKHWPDVPNLGDITMIDWSGVERPDVVCGGFPCQPVSQAGQRRAQADERWLWPEYARAVRDLRPGYVLVENVPGLLVRGLGDVLGDLADLRYHCEWESVPAAAVGAPHLRWRVFILARSEQRRALAHPGSGRGQGDDVRAGRDAAGCGCPVVADTDGGCVHRDSSDGADGRAVPAEGEQRIIRGGRGGQDPLADAAGIEREAVPPRKSPRRSDWWEVEPDVGRVAHGIPSRVDRLRCLGNAVVPQVAEHFGRRIMEEAG